MKREIILIKKRKTEVYTQKFVNVRNFLQYVVQVNAFQGSSSIVQYFSFSKFIVSLLFCDSAT